MFLKRECEFAFALHENQKPLELIRVSGLGHVYTPISPVFLIAYICSLPLPLALGEHSILVESIWITTMTLLFIVLYFVITKNGRERQTLLEEIAEAGIAVSAVVMKKEKILQPAESVEDEIPFYLVTLQYCHPSKAESELWLSKVSEDLFAYLKEDQFVQVRLHPHRRSVGVIESDMQKYLRSEGKRGSI